MLLGNSKFQLGVALCRLFFKGLSPLSCLGCLQDTHKAAFWRHWGEFLLAGGSVRWLCCAPSRQQTAPFGPAVYSEKANTALKNRSVREEFLLVYNGICHTKDFRTRHVGSPPAGQESTCICIKFQAIDEIRRVLKKTHFGEGPLCRIEEQWIQHPLF